MFGQMQQAKSQAAMAEYGAAMQRQQAGQLKKAGEIEYQRREQEGQKLLSKQMSLYGASGIEPMEGSPLMVMETTAAEIERDALMARYKYQLGAHQAGVSAALQEFQAKAYKDALPWQMAGTMFSGLGSAILPFVKGKTLLTGLSPLLGEAEWKPFSK
jgi:hypothetical protein